MFQRSLTVAASLLLASQAAAQFTAVQPFEGRYQEDFETFAEGSLGMGPVSILGGAARLQANTPSLTIFTQGSWGMSGNGLAKPASGIKGLGVNSATDRAIITFDTPIVRFGGYWSHSTTGDNNIEFTFRNRQGGLIGRITRTVSDPSGTLRWYGWKSPTPIYSVEVSGRFPAADFIQVGGVVTPVERFTALMQEDFEQFPAGNLGWAPRDIFGGNASMYNSEGAMNVYMLGTFNLAGNGSARPFSGYKGLGSASSTARTSITFNNPVNYFGGFWSHRTGGLGRFEVLFKDASGGIIDIVYGEVNDPSGNLQWFGWGSPVPIREIEITGNFPVFDFLQAGQTNIACHANCDSSTLPPVLNIDDFTCFINTFAAAQPLPHAQQVASYANCDGSTAAPVLNIDDFTCFINSFATGCP